MPDKKTLNKNQKEAVTFGEGPLLIIAGAGTGKTTVITERIKYLILEKNISPESIVALTFTEKAAAEMQERVDIALPYGYSQLWISTFHSFCEKILRDEAHHIGLDPNFKLMSQAESVFLLRQNIFEIGLRMFRPLGNPVKFLDALLIHFSRLKDEDINPDEYIAWAKKLRNKEERAKYLELAFSFEKYEALKTKSSLMDFSDLISNTLLLFRKRENILKEYQSKFKFVLVDEFQDTNYAQNELAILLAGDDKNITVVADDDQSIYRFRGAAVSNVIQFKKNFPTSNIITLIENYRSTQTILDAAYRLIQHNNPNRLETIEGIDKHLRSNTSSKEHKVELIHEKRADDESDQIAKKINELDHKGYEYRDIAILIRANNYSRLVTAALQRYKIPFQFLGPGYLFQQEEIKDLIAYLSFLTNLSDTISLFRVLSMDIFDIPYIELNFLLNFAKKNNLTLFEALTNPNLGSIKDETKLKLAKFRKMAEKHLLSSKKELAGRVLYDFLVDSGIYESLNKTESATDERRVQNIAKFFDRIKNFELERQDANIFTLVDWLNLMLQMGDSPIASDIDVRDANAVNILTVHSSKGLEFKIVFMVNLVNDRFPSRERAEKIPLPNEIIKEVLPKEIDFHTQEERRLFYVGMTRAKERLILTSADYYGSAKRIKKISPFVFEALPDLKIEQSTDKIEQLTLDEALSPYVHESIQKLDKKNPYKVSYITYSNLQMFDICPLHYKARVIFNIPTPASSIQTFGISLHKTLQEFYQHVKLGEKVTQKQLLDTLSSEWQSEGYENKQHEQERKKQAEKMLIEYYKKEFDPKRKILGLELPFTFQLKNGIKVFGKIDRIDKTKNGIEIIDYKTGEENPKASSSHELQLEIYALAASRIRDSIFDTDPDKIKLTLHFLEKDTKRSLSFSSADLEKLENDLIAKAKEIESSDFKCSGSVLCINCEYKMLCNPHL